MRKILLALFVLVMISCGSSIKVKSARDLSEKSGVIGVFRQPIGFCSGGYKQWIDVNGDGITVKPTWTSNQDNLFSAFIESGDAEITQYSFGCGATLTTISLEDKVDPNKYPTIEVPESGFCKIVISLLEGQAFFQKNDSLIRHYFSNENINVAFESIPYCETK